MKIEGTGYQIMRNRAGEIWYEFGKGWKKATGAQVPPAETLLKHCGSRNKLIPDIDVFNSVVSDIVSSESSDDEVYSPSTEDIVNKLISFFSEFHFEPNFRFINTLTHFCHKSTDLAKRYIMNYFELTDSPYYSSVGEKMKSTEFKSLISDIASLSEPETVINKRLKLYYGSQGTGKTTVAMREANNYCVVCHSAILPQDLMEDFRFIDGKAGFHPSAFCKAITEGKTIVLDEINLLPFESLRFLQSILDGKKSFTYKDKVIDIKEGFQVIGTMNLVVNGCSYPLPEPLVDRAQELKKFRLTAKDLVEALA